MVILHIGYTKCPRLKFVVPLNLKQLSEIFILF